MKKRTLNLYYYYYYYYYYMCDNTSPASEKVESALEHQCNQGVQVIGEYIGAGGELLRVEWSTV